MARTKDTGPTKALNIILENRRHGIPNDADFYDRMKSLFLSIPCGTASQFQVNPNPVAEAPADEYLSVRKPQFPHGTFEGKTQDGMCEYKNHNKGNTGALGVVTRHIAKEPTPIGRARFKLSSLVPNLARRSKGGWNSRSL